MPVTERPIFTQPEEGTIVIIANRGPHDFVWEDGQWIAKSATGGLLSMIEPLARQPNVAWFCCVSEPPGSEAERDALYVTAKDQTDPELNVVPVPLPADIYQDYYGEISNEILWMLQHHLVGQFGYASLDAKRHQAWHGYLEANRRLADAVVATELPVSAFLIQDYHLYPLAEMLRERFPETPSLHFIHIPFPDPSVLKLIPRAWREAILRGLLGADVVGLQTSNDVRAFLGCCEELLNLAVNYQQGFAVLANGRTVQVRAFAASADPEAVRALVASVAVQHGRERVAAEMRELNIIRVDRLDPSKNQTLGFTAFGRLLERRPDLCGRVRFLAFLVPSRTDLTIYREYRDAVYAEIERVNAQFRDACGFDPIRVFYTNDRAQALAAMEQCDVLLANSRQDGMNLVVKEWALVAQKPGVLVVSETAGVAAECARSALLICPLDIEGTAQAMADALAMPLAARAVWVQQLRSGIERWTARHWLTAQLHELGLPAPPAPVARPAAPPAESIEIEVRVQNIEGIHARPAAMFVRCAREFESKIEIVRGSERFSAKSILEILSANLPCGTVFTIHATGPDAAAATDRLRALVESFVGTRGEPALAKSEL
jgi:trehalose 6-phosphate synthase